MMRTTLAYGIIIASIGYLHAMDTEKTPLVNVDHHELVTVILDDGITLEQAYKNGLRANTQGYLIYTDRNLISCAGLRLYKDKLHLDTLTHLDLKRNKLTEFHAEFLSEMPNLVHIDLSDNQISVGCNPIPPHQNLKTALLHNNKLTTFPLEQFLTNVPVKQLTLDGNQITNYGTLSSNHTSIEELWIDNTAPSWTKKMIASRCPNLVAEMCEHDTTVQDAHTEMKFRKICLLKCGGSTFIGTMSGFCVGFVGSMLFWLPCICIDTCRWNVIEKSSLGFNLLPIIMCVPAGAGIVAGSLIGLTRACCCILTPDERRMQKTILKAIAQYPPIIQKLKQRAQEKLIEEQKT